MSSNDSTTSEYDTKLISSIGENLYLNERFADFYFIIKSKSDDGQIIRIPVHKMLLATASDVFEVMFNGSWKEKVDVEIVDATADAFKEFLQFIYLPKAKVTIENVAEVMNLGKKYNVVECFNICARFLEDHLNDDDICTVYGLAIYLEHKDLEIRCAKYIAENSKTIFKSENPFKHCERKTVECILQMESLRCSEAEVFKSLVKWMQEKIKSDELTQDIVQSQFSNLLHELRFGSMTLDEFVSLDSSYGALFTSAELFEIIQMIHSYQFQPKIFKKNLRNYFKSFEWDEKAVLQCHRLSSSTQTPYYIKNIETTTFTVNRLVVLGEFLISGVYTYSYVYSSYNSFYEFKSPSVQPQSEITIFEIHGSSNPGEKLVLFNERKGLVVGNDTRIILQKPIFIRPGYTYEIQIKMENLPSTQSFCTNNQLKYEVQIQPDIAVRFHNDPTINDAATGLIHCLRFNSI